MLTSTQIENATKIKENKQRIISPFPWQPKRAQLSHQDIRVTENFKKWMRNSEQIPL